jgi:hypothetical protein
MSSTMRFRADWRILALLAASAGCGGARPAESTLAPASSPTGGPGTDGRASGPLPPLSAKERALGSELRKDVEQLSKAIGERNADKKWELASASDYIAGELEGAGYVLDRQGYEVGEIVAQNLEVVVPGAAKGEEVVVVGAHYDSARGTPGANDNASGGAALLALARRFREARPARTLRFVAFANQEAPFFQTADMGSVVYAKRAAARGDKIVGMLSIESIGYYSDAVDSQRHPAGLAGTYPTTGNFIAILGNEASRSLVDRVLSTFLRHGSISAQGATLSKAGESAAAGDDWSFWQVGYPAVVVTDTASLRYPHHHKSDDTPDKLDFERMARVVAGLEGAIGELVDVPDEPRGRASSK